jgi:hypothetical protein
MESTAMDGAGKNCFTGRYPSNSVFKVEPNELRREKPLNGN